MRGRIGPSGDPVSGMGVSVAASRGPVPRTDGPIVMMGDRLEVVDVPIAKVGARIARMAGNRPLTDASIESTGTLLEVIDAPVARMGARVAGMAGAAPLSDMPIETVGARIDVIDAPIAKMGAPISARNGTARGLVSLERLNLRLLRLDTVVERLDRRHVDRGQRRPPRQNARSRAPINRKVSGER